MTKKKSGDQVEEDYFDPVDEPDAPQANGQKAPTLTPRQRFQKHAERRVSQLIKAMKRLANLGSKQSYEYTDGERDQMLQAVDDAHRMMRGRFFQLDKRAKEDGFRFSQGT